MMTGENIICFAKDFSEVPTSNNHVMAELSRHNRVLWLNSIATRRPSLSNGRDLRKIVKKLGTLRTPLTKVRDNFWIHTPLVLPLPHNRIAQAINRRVVALMLRRLRRKLGMKDFQLWTFLPNTGDYIGQLGESVAVYYCVDEWSKFAAVDGVRIAAAERELCKRVDIVFATAESLAANRRPDNRETHLARHGVDHTLFAKALDPSTQIPAELAALSRPIIGFYGTLRDWVDQDLILYLAQRHPGWSIALIGDHRIDVGRLRNVPNIHLIDRMPHENLPGCCKAFDVGIIPYRVDDPAALHANPIKLREYLSAGLPVVSTPLAEAAAYEGLVAVAPGYPSFERCVVEAIASDSPNERIRRSEAMRGETWERRVAQVSEQVLRVKRQRERQTQ
jgi:glycosyltransferase involved in cell wall biosynthesis